MYTPKFGAPKIRHHRIRDGSSEWVLTGEMRQKKNSTPIDVRMGTPATTASVRTQTEQSLAREKRGLFKVHLQYSHDFGFSDVRRSLPPTLSVRKRGSLGP